jgi:hypothetical protein
MPLTKVSAGVIAANAVQESVGSQSITGDKLGLTAINANNIVGGSITGDKLGLTAINANNIVNATITGNKIALGTITGDDIATGQITANLFSSTIYASNSDIFGVSANANTFGNNIIIVSSNTSTISVGDIVSGSNIAPNTVVITINSSPPTGRSNLTISNAAAGSNTNTAVSFYSSTKVISPGIAGPGLCKAWVNFNGTDSVLIRAAYNVSSITDYGAMYYGVNFTNPLPDANYSASVFGSNVNDNDGTNFTGFSGGTGNRGTSLFAFRGLNIFAAGANQSGDCAIVNVVIFR